MNSINGIQRKKVYDLIGASFGRLTVTKYLGIGKWNKHYWECSCSCGGTIILPTHRASGKGAQSCGCLRKETLLINRNNPTKHGLHKHKLYAIYHSMKDRCSNPKSQRWEYYGGKGIKVLWENFESFYEWSYLNGYIEGLSIDRINNNGNYEPNNCQWISVAENTRKAHLGKRKKSNS